MNFLEFHKRKQSSFNKHNWFREGSMSNTKNYINAQFSQSPFYKIINIEGKEVESRVIRDKSYKSGSQYEEKTILFKPDTIINRGSYVNMLNDSTRKLETWLIMFFETDLLYPKAYIRYCNKFLDYGNGEKYPCVITSSVGISTKLEENNELTLPKSYLLASVKSTVTTLNTKENQRFLIDGNAYSVQAVDTVSNVENNIGIVQMNLKKVPKNNDEVIALKDSIDTSEGVNNNWEW